MKHRDDECFGDGMDDGLDTDFDFEGNLALFDKAAVFSEINISERRNGARSRGTPQEQTPSRYRHDENILEAKPIVYRQITVPQPGAKEYCTGKLFHIVMKQMVARANYQKCTVKYTCVVFPYRLWARCTQYILWTTPASVVSRWASWSLTGAKTWNDWSVCKSDGTYIAGRAQQVSMYSDGL